MRGENPMRAWVSAAPCGTSPRARGKPLAGLLIFLVCGNIPACAGKTSGLSNSKLKRTEHPRVRGENMSISYEATEKLGTSPRARGKLGGLALFVTVTRNIPACAGKTLLDGHAAPDGTEHPRVRGENVSGFGRSLGHTGTSPRARGKPLLTCGSSFLRVILHSILFFCTVGVPWNPPAAPSFLSVLVPESSFTASSGPACFRLTAALFGGTVDDF